MLDMIFLYFNDLLIFNIIGTDQFKIQILSLLQIEVLKSALEC